MSRARQQDKRPEPSARVAAPVQRTADRTHADLSPRHGFAQVSPRYGFAPVSPRHGLAEGRSDAAAPAASRADGLPEPLKRNVEAISGLAMDDVKVHRNSAKPATLDALAFTQGSEIHLGAGQEKHLPHEAWHVVQQKQGGVRATMQMKGVPLNADSALEREADAMAQRLPATVIGPAPSAAPGPAAGPGVVQRRTYNPYGDATATGGGSTAHHIVPDELLTAAIGYLGDQGTAVRRQFLPAFDSLTMRQLVETGAITIRYAERPNDADKNVNAAVVRASEADAAYTTTFGALSNEQKGRMTLAGLAFDAFRQGYSNLREGKASAVPDQVAHELLETFFEWQAGNLMLGPSSEKRLEPGAKNEFDADARFILDNASHVEALSAIYDTLKKLKADWDKATALVDANARIVAQNLVKAAVTEALGKMAKLNAGVSSVKAHDESLWIPVKSQKQADMLEQLEGKKRPNFKKDTKIPAGLVADLIAKKKGDATAVRALLTAIKNDHALKDAGALLQGMTLKFAGSGKKTVRLAVTGYEEKSVEIARDLRGYSFDGVVAAAKEAVAAAFDAAAA